MHINLYGDHCCFCDAFEDGSCYLMMVYRCLFRHRVCNGDLLHCAHDDVTEYAHRYLLLLRLVYMRMLWSACLEARLIVVAVVVVFRVVLQRLVYLNRVASRAFLGLN